MENIFLSFKSLSKHVEKYSTQAHVEKKTMHFLVFLTKASNEANFWEGSSIIV